MANADSPRGFEPIGNVSGSDYVGKTGAYLYAAAETDPLGRGDLVRRTGEMTIVDGQAYPVVTRAAAADNELEGAVVGFEPDATGFTTFRSSGAKSDPRIVYVLNDPFAEFEAQADGDIPDASAGLNADIIVGDANSTTGQSIMEIDSGTTTAPATTAGLPLKLIRRSRVVNNESGANAVWVVTINQHALRDTTGV